MDIQSIQQEVDKVGKSSFAHKTDRQLWSYQELSDKYYSENGCCQPQSLKKFNKATNRRCKLTIDKAREIRRKYIPHVYGKKQLALEYGVSKSVIMRIIKGISWRDYEDPG